MPLNSRGMEPRLERAIRRGLLLYEALVSGRDTAANEGQQFGKSELGQTEKNSVRANVFRFVPELGHCSAQSACLKGANMDIASALPMLRWIGGAFHLPRNASSFGQQRRMGI